jgi:putative peptidoglycan lipid II flippase
VLIGGLVGVLCGISNDRGDFTLPSLSPLLASIAVIAAVLAFPGDATALAWGTMLGGVGQLLLQAPAGWKLLRAGEKPLAIDFHHPEVKLLWPLLLPASISQTIGTINVIIGTNFASSLARGQISIFDYANKLFQLPLGILMTALLIPLFPLLTKAVVGDDRPGLFHWLNRGLDTIALATLPLAALFIAVGEPIVAVLYQRGAFTAEATHQTYLVLAIASFAIVAYAARDLFIRVFYALNDSRTPLIVSVLSIATTTLFMALLVGPFKLNGLAAATAAVTIFNCLLIGFLLRRKLGELPLGHALGTFAKSGGAAFAAGGAAWGVGLYLAKALPVGGFLGHAILAGAQSLVLAGVYVAALAVLGYPVGAYAEKALARFRRKPQPA